MRGLVKLRIQQQDANQYLNHNDPLQQAVTAALFNPLPAL